MTREQERRTAPSGIAVRKWVRRWGFDPGAPDRWVLRDKLIGGLDVRVHALFRYPPALDIPADLAEYRKMKPLPALRLPLCPVYTE